MRTEKLSSSIRSCGDEISGCGPARSQTSGHCAEDHREGGTAGSLPAGPTEEDGISAPGQAEILEEEIS